MIKTDVEGFKAKVIAGVYKEGVRVSVGIVYVFGKMLNQPS